MMDTMMIQPAQPVSTVGVGEAAGQTVAADGQAFQDVLGSAISASSGQEDAVAVDAAGANEDLTPEAAVDTEMLSALGTMVAQAMAGWSADTSAVIPNTTPSIDALLAVDATASQPVEVAVVGEVAEQPVVLEAASAVQSSVAGPELAQDGAVAQSSVVVGETMPETTTTVVEQPKAESVEHSTAQTEEPAAPSAAKPAVAVSGGNNAQSTDAAESVANDSQSMKTRIEVMDSDAKTVQVRAEVQGQTHGAEQKSAATQQFASEVQSAAAVNGAQKPVTQPTQGVNGFFSAQTGAGAVSGVGGTTDTSNAGSDTASTGSESQNAAFALQGKVASAGDIAAKGAARAQAASADTNVHQRVIDQVVREVRLSQANGHNDIVVKLSPPELGALRVQITQDAQGVTSLIQASNSQVKSLLQAHLPMLQDALSSAGVRMDTVTVTDAASFGTFMQNSPQQGSSNQQAGARRQRPGGFGMTGAAAIAGVASAAAARVESASYSWLA